MAIVIPASCGGGGSDDTPQPTPTPSPTPTPEPEPELDITGLDNLKGISFQVDQETDLLSGITFGNGAELTKVEIEKDGQRSEVADPHHFTPEYPGTCSIILTVKSKEGTITEYKAENLTIKPLEYKTMEITNIKPSDILPILKDWEGNQDIQYLDVIKLAEATRIRDMMREYGAGNHSKEEYQKLMSRLNTGMISENPK